FLSLGFIPISKASMLQVNFIRDNFGQAVEGLNKRHFPNAENLLAQVLELDDSRKESQVKRDQLQAESKLISRQIGEFLKSGSKEEANRIKSRTADIKVQVKALENDYAQLEEQLKQLL